MKTLKVILGLLMTLLLVISISAVTQTFARYIELKPILENWDGTAEQLDIAMEYACNNPITTKIINGLYYNSNFSDLSNVGFQCTYRGTNYYSKFWGVGSWAEEYCYYSSWLKKEVCYTRKYNNQCTFDFNTKTFSCPESLNMYQYFDYYHSKFPVLVGLPICGDGEVNQESEECDDGNNEDLDGCSAECKTEHYTSPICPEGYDFIPSMCMCMTT